MIGYINEEQISLPISHQDHRLKQSQSLLLFDTSKSLLNIKLFKIRVHLNRKYPIGMPNSLLGYLASLRTSCYYQHSINLVPYCELGHSRLFSSFQDRVWTLLNINID